MHRTVARARFHINTKHQKMRRLELLWKLGLMAKTHECSKSSTSHKTRKKLSAPDLFWKMGWQNAQGTVERAWFQKKSRKVPRVCFLCGRGRRAKSARGCKHVSKLRLLEHLWKMRSANFTACMHSACSHSFIQSCSHSLIHSENSFIQSCISFVRSLVLSFHSFIRFQVMLGQFMSIQSISMHCNLSHSFFQFSYFKSLLSSSATALKRNIFNRHVKQ